MNGKQFVVSTLFAMVLLTVTFIPVSSQQIGPYDPWLDTNEDGNIDIIDLATTAKAYGALGEPTKNVKVMNWPLNQNVNLTNWKWPLNQNVNVTNWNLPLNQSVNVTNWPTGSNVTVANWPLDPKGNLKIVTEIRSLNLSLASSRYLAPGNSFSVQANVDGYKDVTVGAYNTGDASTILRIYFIIGGARVLIDSFTAAGIGGSGYRSLAVLGPTILITAENSHPSYSTYVSIGLYAVTA